MNKLRNIIVSVAFLMTGLLSASAQDLRQVKGRVLDATTGQPLSGVLVGASERQGYSTITESDGTYTLKVPTIVTSLKFTLPGYNMVKSGLPHEDRLRDIMLYPATFSDNYSTETNVNAKAEATGFQFSNSVAIEDEIQKQLGAQVRTIPRSGTPGIGSVMFIGGISSINANAQPLIVIDGVIYDQQYGRTMLHDGFYNDILANISPTDIEKVEVLQNGTALYGAKGANGVILINTRRNHSMATRITASLSGGVTFEPKTFDVMNASQYRSYASDLLQTTNTTLTKFKFLDDSPSNYYWPQYNNNTNWRDHVYRTAFTQNYSINIEGGDEVADYNLSLGYIDQQSTLDKNKMNRINIRFNSDIHITKKLDIRFDASFANQTRNLRNDGAPENYTEGTPTSAAFLAYAKSPIISPWTFSAGKIREGFVDVSDETYLDEALSGYSNYNYKLANPLALNQYSDAENKNHFENSMVNLAIRPKFQFNSHLSLSEHFSYNLVNTNEKLYIPHNGVPSYYVASVNNTVQNEVRSMAAKQNSIMSDTHLAWNNRYDAHNINLFAGARFNWEDYTQTAQLGYNTTNDKMPAISSSLDNATPSGYSNKWKNIACYLHAQYDYLQRYYLQLNAAAETSSRFGRDADHSVKLFEVPWGIFHGAQASWVVTNEPWLAAVNGIDYLKLSVGYDVSGNDDIDYFAARSYFASQNFMQDVSGLSFANIGNTHLQWETTTRFNAGLEANFLANRLNVRLNYFRSKVDNMLMYQPLHFTTGLRNNWSNDGAMKNEGFDVSFNVKLLALKNFQWELGASMGHYKNKVTQLPDGDKAVETSVYGATIRTAVGQTANLFYGYRTQRVFSTSEEAAAANLYTMAADGVTRQYFAAGDVHFTDINLDGQISDADRMVIGDPNPDIYGNIFTSLAYKRFKLDVRFNYSLGNDVYNYMRQQMESGCRFMNQTTAITSRWQTEGQQTDMPRVTFQDPLGNSRFSDRWIEDGSYLKLKTVTLSYTLPMNTEFIQGLQFWIQCDNVFTLTKYLGSDPEFAMTNNIIGQGIDVGRLPQSRTLVAGVKINL
ncbi:MAG: SusC/RagA family TonB-linked outer membrane protein [Prevotella sp.]|nr:SusC/RagA family TonB-linked outer membrane protein [Prevotella sp.]